MNYKDIIKLKPNESGAYSDADTTLMANALNNMTVEGAELLRGSGVSGRESELLAIILCNFLFSTRMNGEMSKLPKPVMVEIASWVMSGIAIGARLLTQAEEEALQKARTVLPKVLPTEKQAPEGSEDHPQSPA